MKKVTGYIRDERSAYTEGEKRGYQKGYRAGDKHGFNQGYWVGRSERNIAIPEYNEEKRIKDLIVNNPRAKDRIELKEIDRQIKYGAGIGNKESR